MVETLVNNGLPARSATGIVELYSSLRTGKLDEDYERHKPTLGNVKQEDFAQEFAAAFHRNDQP
jgi:hypothetical protein